MVSTDDFDLRFVRPGLRQDCCENEKEVGQISSLRLAKQWQIVATEQDGEIGKSALFPVPALQAPERR
jgi:hypothetical protein